MHGQCRPVFVERATDITITVDPTRETITFELYGLAVRASIQEFVSGRGGACPGITFKRRVSNHSERSGGVVFLTLRDDLGYVQRDVHAPWLDEVIERLLALTIFYTDKYKDKDNPISAPIQKYLNELSREARFG